MSQRSHTVRSLLVALSLCATACSSGSQAAASCQDEERVVEQQGGHLIGDASPPVPYNSVPPTSGWHSAGAPKYGSFGPQQPLSEAEQVTVLELGGFVISYHEVSDEVRTQIETLVASQPTRLAATAYDKLQPGQVAVTSWGVVQRCDGFDLAAVEAFITRNTGNSAAH